MAAHKLLYHPAVHVSGVVILLCGIVLAATMFLSNSKNASASVSACEVSVSPTSVTPGSTTDFTFSLNNTDSVTYNWIKIRRPGESSDWSINSGNASGWSASTNSNDVTFTGGSLAASGSLSITVNASAADVDNSSLDWVFEVSDNGGGDTFGCSGNLAAAIEDTPVEISNLTISDITSSSVKITWNTNINATATLDYGTTASYGSTASDSTSSTSHTISLSGLSANVVYHFNAKNTASSGLETESGDETFVTAKSGLTSDPVVITNSSTTVKTKTTKTTVTATPTPTPPPDGTGPQVTLGTDLSKPFGLPPTISGTATDPSGIAGVEYSLDNGSNWLPVDKISQPGAKSITFSFTPPQLEDDNYKVLARATDNSPAANIGISDVVTLIIDRLPPRVAGNIISIGPQVLAEDESGYLITSTHVKHKITLAAIGGPVQIELTVTPEESGTPQTIRLKKNPDNGLWSGQLTFEKEGLYSLSVKSIDGAGNQTQRQLNHIAVFAPGHIAGANNAPVEKATVTLYHFDEQSQDWRVWTGEAYGQKNPQPSNTAGEFAFLLPAGKYYLYVDAPGFGNTISQIFTIEKPQVLNPTLKLKPLKLLFDLGFFKFYLPDFSTTTVPVDITPPSLPDVTSSLIGEEAPAFTLPTTAGQQFSITQARGTPVVFSFTNTWSPTSADQIAALDKLASTSFKAYLVMVGESLDKIGIFKRRGEYKTNAIVDRDATLAQSYGLTSLPTHYFVDKRGVVQEVVSGVLSESEMEEIMLEIQ